MKIHYTGKLQGLTPAQHKKLQARYGKLGKVLDRKEEKEAHVILTSERHLHRAEITVNYYDHPLVGIASGPDLFGALASAVDKLQKQLLKQRAKWRDTKRNARSTLKSKAAAAAAPAAAVAVAEAEEPEEKRVFRVNNHAARKPMTLDEALLEMEQDRDYLVYRDAGTDRMAVLLRRRDGHFDLIEA